MPGGSQALYQGPPAESSRLWVRGVGGDCSCFSAAHLAKGEALPASVGQSSANLGKSILSRSVDIGNDLFTQAQLSTSGVTWRIASKRQTTVLSTAELKMC